MMAVWLFDRRNSRRPRAFATRPRLMLQVAPLRLLHGVERRRRRTCILRPPMTSIRPNRAGPRRSN